MTAQPSDHLAALEPASPGSVVVGHDGSNGADHALATALELGDLLQTDVIIVRAWSIRTAPRPPQWTFGYVASLDELQQATLEVLISDARELTERFSQVAVTYRAVHGGPARSLISLSASAWMLVVGSRGLGGIAQVMLGSVSDDVVRNAQCPVLVAKGSRNQGQVSGDRGSQESVPGCPQSAACVSGATCIICGSPRKTVATPAGLVGMAPMEHGSQS